MFTLPQLPYAFDALEPYIDTATMQIHHDKHHAAYIKNLNDALAGLDNFLSMPVETLLTKLTEVPEAIRTKVRNNAGGHANHTLFWTLMSPEKSSPTGKFLDTMTTTFGSVDEFKEKFSAAGIGRFGSGWVWLISDNGKLSIMDTPNQDSPLMDLPAGRQGVPILGLDVWEHAYYLKYQNMRADYINAWWNVVNWKEVERRYATG